MKTPNFLSILRIFYSNLLQHWLWYIPGDDTIEAVSVTSVSSFLSTLACCSSSWSSWWLSKLAFSVSIFDGVVASTPPLYRSLWWFGTDGLRTTCQKIKKCTIWKMCSFSWKKSFVINCVFRILLLLDQVVLTFRLALVNLWRKYAGFKIGGKVSGTSMLFRFRTTRCMAVKNSSKLKQPSWKSELHKFTLNSILSRA